MITEFRRSHNYRKYFYPLSCNGFQALLIPLQVTGEEAHFPASFTGTVLFSHLTCPSAKAILTPPRWRPLWQSCVGAPGLTPFAPVRHPPPKLAPPPSPSPGK